VNYLFDVLGNLKFRHDLSGQQNLKEDFAYDAINRLKQVRLTAPGLGIHAVMRAGSANYAYDTNGNQLNGNGRNISYTVFDKAARMEAGSDVTEFTYGIGHQRVKREDSISGELHTTTLYLGNVEYLTSNNGRTQFKRYLGGVAIATFYPATSVQNVSYLLKDHIGSIHSILNEDGQITGRQHFSPFGERQDINWQSPLDSFLYSPFNGLTTRGFTGHEHVDSMGIIHMNGRIYDPKLGRFLQADTFIQAPGNTQSLNRYSYVFNNPLSNTDPSGHFSLSKFFKKWGRTIAAIAASYFLPGASGLLSMHFGVSSALA
jgi:RHS repeat-associated protein